MSISSVDMFKKVAIENGYEFDNVDEDEWVTYGYNIVRDFSNKINLISLLTGLELIIPENQNSCL